VATLVKQNLTVAAGEVHTYAQNTDYFIMAALLVGRFEGLVGETYFEPTILNYGEMHLDDAGFGTGQLLYFSASLSWNYGVVKNYGLMSAVVPAASSIRVLFGPGWSPDVYNYGTIVAQAQNDSIGYETWDGGSLFVNGPAAVVQARGAERALALYFPNGGTVTNDGQLLAHVTGGGHPAVPDSASAIAFGFSGFFSESSIVNTGLIEATGTDPAQLVEAITIRGETRFSIVNSGTIRGTNAVAQYSSGTTGSVSIENHGLIEGNVILGVGNDKFVNLKQMAGSVDLGAGDDVYDGAAGTVTGPIRGGAGNDRLTAGAGNQQMFGGDGDDSLDGGAGNDALDGGAGLDTVSYATAGAGVTVSLATTGPQATGGAGSDSLTAIENLSGSGYADILTGNGSANRLAGGAGGDRLAGGGGADRLEGGAGGDVFVFTAPSDSTAAGQDRIVGFEPGVDKIDLLGLGPVSLSWQSLADGTGAYALVTAVAAGGTLTVRVDTAHALSSSDFLVAGIPTEGDDQLFGSDGADTIDGLGGNDRIDGLLGADRLSGGSGDDTILFSGIRISSPAPPAGAIDGGTGFDTIDLRAVSPSTVGTSDAGFSIWVGSQMFAVTGVERILLGSGNDHAFLPDDRADALEIRGGGGNDVLFGSGAYSLYGEEGDDEFFVSGTFGALRQGRVDGGTGQDLLKTNIGFSVDLQAGTAQAFNASYIVSGIEDVAVSLSGYAASVSGDGMANRFSVLAYGDDGKAGVTFDGRGGDDFLTGGAGNDILAGGSGADQLAGGLGNDVYTMDTSDTIIEAANAGIDEVRTVLAAYTLGANLENLTGTSSAGQSLTGNGLANRLAGGAGADQFAGGLGNDVYLVGAGDIVTEAANAGTDQVQTSLAAYTLGANVENLTGTSSAGQSLTGNDLANGLAGGTGADQFAGGLGNDVYVTASGDVVTEAANAGTDEVQTALAAYTLGANVERLTGISAAGQTLTGNGLSNLITGGAGNDVIAGGSGADMLAGGLGNDVYTMDTSDTIVEAANAGIDEVRTAIAAYTLGANVENLTGTSSAGQSLTGNGLANRLTGGGGNDVLDGGAGNDTLAGGNGADLLVGGTGADSLKGGAGADVFRYDAAADSTAAAPDLIGDFQVGVDKIDLHPIDANTFAAGDQAFHWIGANAFSGTGAASAGELRVYQSGSYWWAAGDTNGDGTADLVIALTPQNGAPLGQGDFLP
jgi:Ca2+-binding RTX toxin-like protein